MGFQCKERKRYKWGRPAGSHPLPTVVLPPRKEHTSVKHKSPQRTQVRARKHKSWKSVPY